MQKLQSLQEIQAALQSAGYETNLAADSASLGVKMSGGLVATLIIQENRLVISCQLAKLGDFDQSKIMDVLLSSLGLNIQVAPFATALLMDESNPDLDEMHEWLLLLTDSIMLGDLSGGELSAEMTALETALAACLPMLQEMLRK